MRLRGKGAVLIGAEGKSPPLPWVEVEDGEAQALVDLGFAEKVADEGDQLAAEWAEAEANARAEAAAEEAERQRVAAEAEAAAARAAAEAEAEAARVAAEAEAARVAAEAAASDTANDTVGDTGGEGETREEILASALDLIDADHLVKTGERAGKPKVSAMEEISGLTDLTADEVDAAVAIREAAHA